MLPRRTRHAAVLCLGLALLAGRATAADGLAVDPADSRLAARPDLLERLTATAHGYFRFVNAAFAGEACRLFSDVASSMPEVNLHGDAHVEQYAVTSLGRGLTDFDDCTRGKAVIDLVRFGSSLLLAAREKGWSAEERRFVDAFLEGYRTGLRGGRRGMRTPELVTRTRAGFHWDHAPALRQAHALIDQAPLPVDAFADGVSRFAELVSFRREVPADFFRAKRVGALTMGVGSALDEKYLIIFEGDTAAAEDDLVVEAKQIRDLAGNPCVRTDVGASRVLDGQRLIAYEPFALRGGRPPRRQVLLDARLDGRLPGGVHSLRHPLAARPAGDRLRRGGADGPGPPQAARRATGQGPQPSGPSLTGRDRGPGPRRRPRDGRQDGRGLAGVQAPGECAPGECAAFSRNASVASRGRGLPRGVRRGFPATEVLTARGRKRGPGLPRGLPDGRPWTTKQLRPPGGCLASPRCITKPTPSRGRCRPGPRRGP